MKFDNSNNPLRRRTSRWRTGLLGIAAALIMAPAVEAQVAYSQNFDVNAGAWTGFTHYTGATACGGAGGAVRFNLYSFSTTANLVSPLLGSSVAGVVTINYSYKANDWSANTTGTSNWGTFNVQRASSASGPWTTIATVTNETQSGACLSKSHTFSPPAGALYVRFSAAWQSGDYYLNFDNIVLSETGGAACTGTPAPGNTTGPSIVCAGANFTLGLTNNTSGSGVTYQWQRNTGSGMTNFGTNAATQVTSQTVATTYQCIVTCSGVSGISTPKTVTVNTSSCECGTYSSTFASSPFDEDITTVTVGSMTNNSACSALAPGAGSVASLYSNYTGSVAGPTAAQGALVSFSAGQGTLCGGSYSNIVQIYVDWNQDGTFNSTDERVYNQPVAGTGVNVATGSFTVPQAASLGSTRMRIVVVESGATATNYAQTGYTWGETEDYCFTVTVSSPCAGTPNPGNTTGPAGTASGGTVNLGLQNNTPGSGVSYQWYVSTTSAVAGFSPVGPNAPTYAPSPTVQSWYYADVTCASGGTGSSSVKQIDILAVNLVPQTGSAILPCGTNTILRDHAGTGDYANSVDGYIVLEAGGTATISITGSYNTESCCDDIFIYAGAGIGGTQLANYFGSGTANFTSAPGQTITVRLISDSSVPASGFDFTVSYSGACPTCIQPTALAATNVTSSGADVSWTCSTCTGDYVVEYGAPGFTPGTGITAGAGGTVWTGTAVPASPVTLSGLSSISNYSVVVRERCGPGEFSSNTSPVNFTTLCSGTSCNYLARIGDLFGDGWDGSIWQVKQNGVVVATLGPQVVGCGDGATGYVDVPVTICEGSTVTLEWTTLGSFANEKALQFFNPFGLLLYDFRGTATYTNCPGVNWTSSNSTATTGLKFTTTGNCTPPTCNVSTSVVEDCLAGTYDITLTDIDVVGIGTVQYTLNGVAQTDIPFTSPTTTISGIDVAQAADITLVTDQGCTNVVGNVQSACAVELDCNATSPLPFAHCYSNGDTRTWYFHTPEVGGTIDLKFLAGSTLGAGDNVIFWNGVPNASGQIGSYSGDMSNLTFTGTTEYLGVSITTNATGSCDDGLAGTAWNFTVRCSGCIEPTGQVLLAPDNGTTVDCNTGTFEASVYVGSFGINGTGPNAGLPPATTTISYTANGVAQPNIVLTQTSDDSGVLTSIGTWPIGVELDVTLVHGNGETVCNNQIGTDVTIPYSACPPANDDCASAEVLTLNNDGDCPANSITGTTLGADQTGPNPACSATGTVQDVWYTFNSLNSSSFTMNLTAGTAGNIGVELFSACGTSLGAGACLANIVPANNPITITVLPNTDYWLRIFTNVSTGSAGTFNICVSAFDPCTNITAISGCAVPTQATAPTGVGAWTGYGGPFGTPGKEQIFTFTPTVTGNHNLEVTAITGGWVDFFFKPSSVGCNSTGWTYIDDVISTQSGPSFAMTAGTEYYIMWDPEDQNTVRDVTFSITCAAPTPANDNCAGAISLDASSTTCTTVDGNTAGTTQSFAGCSGTANDDVWYSFLATETSHVIRVNGLGAFNPVFQLFDGGLEPGVCPTAGPGIVCRNLTGAGGLETFTAVGLSIGNRYFVRVYDSGTGTFFSTAPSFNICVTKVPTCLAPTATAATGITTGSAMANWTPNSGGSGTNFIVEYGPAATFTTPGTGLTAGTNGTVILNAVSPQAITGLNDNTQYRYFVRQNCTSTSEGFSFNSNAITFTTLALPPANDDCPGAVLLSGTNTTCITTLGTVAGSTRSLPAPDCTGTADDDVWYKFVAAGAGNYSIIVSGTAGFFDSATQLFSGTSCGALTQVACSDPETMTVQGLIAGNTYYIRVYSWSSFQPANKDFNICVVKNSDCLPPTTITTSNVTSSSADVTVQGSLTANYVLEYGLQSNFTTPGVDGNPGTNGTVITFTGNLQQISGLTALTGYRYFVRRDCGTGVYSGNSFANFFTTLGPPPANDVCANAVLVSCGNTYTGTNVNATSDNVPALVGSGGPTITNGVWYRYVGNNMAVTMDLCASGYDTRINVYSGSCGALTFVGGNDDACPGFRSTFTFTAILGTTYYAIVDGYFGSSGSINMVVSCGAACLPLPSNDACASAQLITPSPIGFCNPVAGSTACAGPSAGANPSCAPSPFATYQDVYYTFTAAGTSHPIQINVVSGALTFWALNEATCGGQQDFCSNTFNSSVSATGLTPGAVYKIRVGSVAAADFNICIGAPSCSQDLTVEWQLGASGAIPAWEMRQIGTNLVVASGGGFNPGVPFAVYPETTCLPAGNFYFVLMSPVDAGGGYVIRLTQTPFTRFIDNAVSVGSGSITEFSAVPAALSSNGPLQIPVGPNTLLYSSCDKYFWATGEYVVVNEDPQVAATWLPNQPDAAQSSTSGYDLWFYDPDGGYSYIRQRRNNVSDNFASIGSARTCHMKVNNWAAANHIPDQAQLNVRVRAVVNNVPKNWGPACRFVRNQALASCQPTKLFDIPGHPAYSCNVFRAFNTASQNRLYARPVSGATKYRFHIYNGETDLTFERTVYYLTLGWTLAVAPPLQDEAVYDVTVEAFVGGQYCPVGEVCTVTICNTPASCTNDIAGGQQNSVLDTDASFLMWPNPNNGAQLNVNLSGVAEGMNTVSMDIFDLSGKRIIARTLAVQSRDSAGGFVNQVVDLNGEISTGMYMVKVTAGDQVYTERLVIQK